jgi:hypothetical protein
MQHMDERIQILEQTLAEHMEQENQDVISLRKDLNGNLAKIHAALLRMEPVIKKFEDDTIFNENIQKLGDKVVWWGKTIGGSAIIYGAIRYFMK